MTIFPCCRCGITPAEPRGDARTGRAVLRHLCRLDGKRYKVTGSGADLEAQALDCIFLWNEANAANDPRWWPERWDYLHGLCPRKGGAAS